jgi:DNA-binding HxlR family transcriptional regulator
MDDSPVRQLDSKITSHEPVPTFSPAVEALTKDLLGHIADKWTMIVLEELVGERTLRFSELRRAIPEISQKMLTQTLRNMERLGLITRTIHPVIPPNVEYRRTELGHSLGQALCSLWRWVECHVDDMEKAQANFDSITPSK